MGILTKQAQDEKPLLGYIFDIFAKYQPVILKEQLLQVVNIVTD